MECKLYHLIGADGKTYESAEPGTLGGHNGLKIYGRLDCKNALNYIAKGQYVKHRVFFKDEETAIAAGYRPCAKCMPEKYEKWMAEHPKVKNANSGETAQPFRMNGAPISVLTA